MSTVTVAVLLGFVCCALLIRALGARDYERQAHRVAARAESGLFARRRGPGRGADA
ncbi:MULTISPECIES: hypothetical protein [Nocardia]|uniref:Uncharacterized protein n=1 Tax=Nocardia arthritidis TaxID=228602 RepID=A0A6G9YNC9_9NOCA|nr:MULTISPECIES: hypothetical protein [Nocardia]QIS14630.1 hypothetical protein F5544_33975 [Nocardia arthritidis]